MPETLANHAPRRKRATPQAKSQLGIILGCHRINGTWEDVAAMARNGFAVIRQGVDVRLVWSEPYETEWVQ